MKKQNLNCIKTKTVVWGRRRGEEEKGHKVVFEFPGRSSDALPTVLLNRRASIRQDKLTKGAARRGRRKPGRVKHTEGLGEPCTARTLAVKEKLERIKEAKKRKTGEG